MRGLIARGARNANELIRPQAEPAIGPALRAAEVAAAGEETIQALLESAGNKVVAALGNTPQISAWASPGCGRKVRQLLCEAESGRRGAHYNSPPGTEFLRVAAPAWFPGGAPEQRAPEDLNSLMVGIYFIPSAVFGYELGSPLANRARFSEALAMACPGLSLSPRYPEFLVAGNPRSQNAVVHARAWFEDSGIAREVLLGQREVYFPSTRGTDVSTQPIRMVLLPGDATGMRLTGALPALRFARAVCPELATDLVLCDLVRWYLRYFLHEYVIGVIPEIDWTHLRAGRTVAGVLGNGGNIQLVCPSYKAARMCREAVGALRGFHYWVWPPAELVSPQGDPRTTPPPPCRLHLTETEGALAALAYDAATLAIGAGHCELNFATDAEATRNFLRTQYPTINTCDSIEATVSNALRDLRYSGKVALPSWINDVVNIRFHREGHDLYTGAGFTLVFRSEEARLSCCRWQQQQMLNISQGIAGDALYSCLPLGKLTGVFILDGSGRRVHAVTLIEEADRGVGMDVEGANATVWQATAAPRAWDRTTTWPLTPEQTKELPQVKAAICRLTQGQGMGSVLLVAEYGYYWTEGAPGQPSMRDRDMTTARPIPFELRLSTGSRTQLAAEMLRLGFSAGLTYQAVQDMVKEGRLALIAWNTAPFYALTFLDTYPTPPTRPALLPAPGPTPGPPGAGGQARLAATGGAAPPRRGPGEESAPRRCRIRFRADCKFGAECRYIHEDDDWPTLGRDGGGRSYGRGGGAARGSGHAGNANRAPVGGWDTVAREAGGGGRGRGQPPPGR